MQFEDIAESIRKYHPNPDLELVEKAWKYASEKHSAQIRENGDPYFIHVANTALLVCSLKLDIASVSAALLHDVVEDCDVTKEDLEKEFGAEIAEIVEGVTNLTRAECGTSFESKEERHAESFRKMLIAMARDIRVILVKLCDRLHNMRTLQYMPEESRQRKAIEVKEIYAPLANRLGLFGIKSELEDLCFKYLREELYEEIQQRFARNADDRSEYISRTTRDVAQLLQKAAISASVKGRSKHFFSVWQKMEKQNLTFDEIHDLIGFRVIVPTVRACYEALGVVHSTWKPVPGRFKDYIAMPKPNMYQSLHTTVVGPEGERIEIQIRTPEMDYLAEEGIAAHWRYKEGGASQAFDLQWVRELVETQQYLKNPNEFIQSVKSELFPDEVFIFTPKGDVERLPFQSTPIDFAYAVHTDVGHTCSGAKVNGSIVPLSHVLENGDTVEVLTSKNHVPSKDWLSSVKSSKARQRIRAFLRSQEQAHSMAIGMEVLTRDLRKVKLNRKKLEKEGRIRELAETMGFRGEGDLYAEIGYGKCKTERIIEKLLPEGVNVQEELTKPEGPIQRIFERAAKASRQKTGVKVSGLGDVMVRFAKCCDPLPGDRITGFITRGRGVAVHHAQCPQVLGSDPRRQVEVRWDSDIKSLRRVRLTVHSEDQRGLLAKVTTLVTDNGADIKSAQIKTTEFGKAVIALELSLEDAMQLRKISRALEKLTGVIKVDRVKSAGAALHARHEKNDSGDS